MDLLRPFCSTQLLWYGDMTTSALLEITAATASPKTHGLATSWDCSTLWATPMPQLFVNRWTSTAEIESRHGNGEHFGAPPAEAWVWEKGKFESLNVQNLGVLLIYFQSIYFFLNHFFTSKSAFWGTARKGNLGGTLHALRAPWPVLVPWRKLAALLWLWSMRSEMVPKKAGKIWKTRSFSYYLGTIYGYIYI